MGRAWTRIIAVLEIAGGLFGIGLLIWSLVSYPIDPGIIVLSLVVGFIFGLSFVAGILLWREHPVGRVASIIVQLIQLPKLVSPLLTFLFSFGFDLYPYWLRSEQFMNLGIDFKFLAFQQLFIDTQGAPTGFGVSIPAVVFLIVLFKTRTTRGSTDPLIIADS